MTIAVDFDGTIVEHRYPKIGEEIPFATETLKILGMQKKAQLLLDSIFGEELLIDTRSILPVGRSKR